eukprot:scaffold62236_cov29-Tisochrysis_lutea.AAC.1
MGGPLCHRLALLQRPTMPPLMRTTRRQALRTTQKQYVGQNPRCQRGGHPGVGPHPSSEYRSRSRSAPTDNGASQESCQHRAKSDRARAEVPPPRPNHRRHLAQKSAVARVRHAHQSLDQARCHAPSPQRCQQATRLLALCRA